MDSLLANSSSLSPSEMYGGEENPIVMETLTKAVFICTFQDIENFPFNSETCSFQLFISGTDNRFTRLEMTSLTDQGGSKVDQYQIKSWTFEMENVTKTAKGREFSSKVKMLTCSDLQGSQYPSVWAPMSGVSSWWPTYPLSSWTSSTRPPTTWGDDNDDDRDDDNDNSNDYDDDDNDDDDDDNDDDDGDDNVDDDDQ